MLDFDTLFKVEGAWFVLYKQEYRQTRDGKAMHLCLRPHQLADTQKAAGEAVPSLRVGATVAIGGVDPIELVVTQIKLEQAKLDPPDLKDGEVFDLSRRVLTNPVCCLEMTDPLWAQKAMELERARDAMLLNYAKQADQGHSHD